MVQIKVQIHFEICSGNRGKEFVFSLTGSSQTVQCIIILRAWAGVYVKRQLRDNAIPSWPVVEVLALAHMPRSKNNPWLQCTSPVICHNTRLTRALSHTYSYAHIPCLFHYHTIYSQPSYFTCFYSSMVMHFIPVKINACSASLSPMYFEK